MCRQAVTDLKKGLMALFLLHIQPQTHEPLILIHPDKADGAQKPECTQST